MKKRSNMQKSQGSAGMGNLESMETNMQSNTMVPGVENIQAATIQNHEGMPIMQSRQKMSGVQNNKSSK